MCTVGVLDDWEHERHEAIVRQLDPAGDQEELADPGWQPRQADSPAAYWEEQRHNYNTEYDLQNKRAKSE